MALEEHVSLKGMDGKSMQRLCGVLDENLNQVGEITNSDIVRLDDKIVIRAGDLDNAKKAKKILDNLVKIAKKRDIDSGDIHLGMMEVKTGHDEANTHSVGFRSKRGTIYGRTPRQDIYIRSLLKYDVVFGLGPAGTGKTYLAVAAAVDAMQRDNVERIVLVRPAVEAGEKLGFLPGDLSQKVDPYLRPLYDALFDLMGFERVTKLLEKGLIEIAPLAYMRGRTLNNSFIILDEAQNTTPEQMKMFLTRIGFGSKAVITGDLSQIDLPRNIKSGLRDTKEKLSEVEGLHFHVFTSEDVVRHPLVQKIVDAYEAGEEADANS